MLIQVIRALPLRQILQERWDSINNKISILEVARLCNIYIKQSSGAEARCLCPFCDCGNGSGGVNGSRQGRPTASINETKGLFYCFRCEEGFNAVSLYARVYGVDVKVAYSELLDGFISDYT